MSERNLKYLTKSAFQTKKLAFLLAQTILQTKKRGPIIIGLIGDLGTGKTTFIQGFSKGLNIKYQIKSPTFLINKKYPLKNDNFKTFYHIDAYRIKTKKDLITTGINDALKDKRGIVIIEWANLIKKYLPPQIIIIKLKHISQNLREIKIR